MVLLDISIDAACVPSFFLFLSFFFFFLFLSLFFSCSKIIFFRNDIFFLTFSALFIDHTYSSYASCDSQKAIIESGCNNTDNSLSILSTATTSCSLVLDISIQKYKQYSTKMYQRYEQQFRFKVNHMEIKKNIKKYQKIS